MAISCCRWRSGLGGNLGASNQNDIAVENGLCNAEEAGHDLRIVVGVHGGLIDEPLISGEDAGLVWSCETRKPIVLGSLLRTFSATSSRARRMVSSCPFLARMTAVMVSMTEPFR